MPAAQPTPVPSAAPAALFPHARPNLRPAEVAAALGMSRNQVAALEEQGLLQAYSISDAPHPQRQHLRYTRASVEGYHAYALTRRGLAAPFPLSSAAAQWLARLQATARQAPLPRPA